MNLNKILTILMLSSPAAGASQIYSVDEAPLAGVMSSQSTAKLCAVARGTLDYLAKGQDYDPDVIKAGVVAQFGINLARVKRTLAFVCEIEQQDKLNGKASRLLDPAFISKHFEMIRWHPDKTQSQVYSAGKPLLQQIPDDKLLVTKYYIKLAKGSLLASSTRPHALYSVPSDEQALTLEQAELKKDQLTRYRFTKQQVLTGILDRKQLATPLIWLSREDLEDTLMQGTVKIDVDGDSQFFNVHRNNGIGYNRNLKKRQQQRYWYFKRTAGVLGYGKDANYKIPIHPLVTVAGDLKHLGLGKLIMLTNNGESRLTILADTGGAFDNNQYQLDYLGGFFNNWDDYIETYRSFPDYFEARILVIKE